MGAGVQASLGEVGDIGRCSVVWGKEKNEKGEENKERNVTEKRRDSKDKEKMEVKYKIEREK
jgi:hypothetical protein